MSERTIKVGMTGMRMREDGYAGRDQFAVEIVRETRAGYYAAWAGKTSESFYFRKSDLREIPTVYTHHYFKPSSK